MTKTILNVLIENQNNYKCFGIRTDDRELNIGDELGCSHDWDFENDTPSEELLPGICATGFGELWYDEDDIETIEKALNAHKSYYGKHTYLIGGYFEKYGDDESEVIISDAEVIAVLK